MTITCNSNAHSADLQIHLFVGGQVLNVGHLGPDFLMLDQSIEHPPADAEILMAIDGEQYRWRIHLPDGISTARKTPIAQPARTPRFGP